MEPDPSEVLVRKLLLVLTWGLLVGHWWDNWDWLQYPSNPDHQDLKHQQENQQPDSKWLLKSQTGSGLVK